MCGISAVLSLGGHPAPSNEKYSLLLDGQLDASLDLVKHRGPDARGTWTSDDGKVCKYLTRIGPPWTWMITNVHSALTSFSPGTCQTIYCRP